MNPVVAMKLMNSGKEFQANHPKFTAFLNRIFSAGLTEGTIIEITVKKPDEEPITSNMKISKADLELVEVLKTLGSN